MEGSLYSTLHILYGEKYMHKGTRKYNQYDLNSEFGIGYDSNNRIFYFDLDDYDKIKGYTWILNNRSSVYTKDKNKNIYLHRLILNCDKEFLVDHINHNPNDNRKSNLRIANKIQNGQNRKNAKGWRYEIKKKRYSARIVVDKKEKHLGYFNNEKDARNVYLDARKKYFGEFAPKENLNVHS